MCGSIDGEFWLIDGHNSTNGVVLVTGASWKVLLLQQAAREAGLVASQWGCHSMVHADGLMAAAAVVILLLAGRWRLPWRLRQ